MLSVVSRGSFWVTEFPRRELKGMDWLHDSEQDMEKNLVPQFLYVQLEDNNSAIAVRMS